LFSKNKTTSQTEQITPVIQPTPITSSPTNTSNNNSQSEIEALQKEVADLKSQQPLSNSTKTTVVTPPPTPPIVTPAPVSAPLVSPPVVVNTSPQRSFNSDGSLNLSSYVNNDSNDYDSFDISDYIKNHKAFLNKPIEIINAVITGFDQENNNYIQVVDANDTSASSQSVELLVDNDNNYTKITNQLSVGDKIYIYGFGENNAEFNVVGNGGSYKASIPVIDVDAIFKYYTLKDGSSSRIDIFSKTAGSN
jgi:hypothetical protein